MVDAVATIAACSRGLQLLICPRGTCSACKADVGQPRNLRCQYCPLHPALDLRIAEKRWSLTGVPWFSFSPFKQVQNGMERDTCGIRCNTHISSFTFSLKPLHLVRPLLASRHRYPLRSRLSSEIIVHILIFFIVTHKSDPHTESYGSDILR
jgi:hypothetical protein